MSGYVYVIRISHLRLEVADPAPVPAGWAAVRDDLCLLKIGRTNSNKLSSRLNVEALAWGKVLAPHHRRPDGALMTKTVGTNTFSVIDTDAHRPDVYVGPSSIDTDDDMANAAYEKFEEMRADGRKCADVGCWLWREERHHIAEDERFVASLMGAPLRAHLLSSVVEHWNDTSFYDVTKRGTVTTRPVGAVHGYQFGESEYVISTNAHFMRLRTQFLARAEGDFSLELLTSAVTVGDFVLRLFDGIDLSFSVPTLPEVSFRAPHLLRVPVGLPAGTTLEAAMAGLGL